jgi:hypothetical protein
MESQTIRLLRQRQAELMAMESELRARLEPIVIELNQIDIAVRAVTGKMILPSGADASAASVAYHKRKANPDIQNLTFKQLVVKALTEQFRNGATANEMLDFFKREWGRDVMRTSLSPQLTRLKKDNLIELEGKTWHLSKAAKASGTPRLFPDENGEAEASPDAGGVGAPPDCEPGSAEHPIRGGSAPGDKETT